MNTFGNNMLRILIKIVARFYNYIFILVDDDDDTHTRQAQAHGRESVKGIPTYMR